MLHGDKGLSEASPVSWLGLFLTEYLPKCKKNGW